MLFGLSDPNGLAERIARARKKTEFEFVIEPLCWAQRRRVRLSFELPHRPPEMLTTHADRRAAAVIADRYTYPKCLAASCAPVTSERQILDWEVRAGSISGGDPTPLLGVMGLVDVGH